MNTPVVKLKPRECVACQGRGYFVKESGMFAGRTYRVNCQKCRGIGATPAPVVRRKVAA